MEIPFDKSIKIVLLAAHMLGFSVWFGSAVIAEQSPEIFPTLAIGSGVLLFAREIIKDGLEWLRCVKGGFTVFKLLILMVGSYLLPPVGLLGIVMFCGLLASHLPKEVKNKKLI